MHEATPSRPGCCSSAPLKKVRRPRAGGGGGVPQSSQQGWKGQNLLSQQNADKSSDTGRKLFLAPLPSPPVALTTNSINTASGATAWDVLYRLQLVRNGTTKNSLIIICLDRTSSMIYSSHHHHHHQRHHHHHHRHFHHHLLLFSMTMTDDNQNSSYDNGHDSDKNQK